MLTVIIGAIIVGLILGLLGSGGSAIMVPILVYLVGHDAKISIAESMAIVGAISLTGAIPYARNKLIDWHSAVLFGVPAMAGTFLGAWLGGLSSDAVQLTVFGAVLLLSAGLMIRKAFGKKQTVEETESDKRPPVTLLRGLLIVLEGVAVGALTGFVGVGGGFLIVPALFILGKLPMRTAIATSLVIIVMKSLVGFFKYQQFLTSHDLSVDWATIAIFIGIGVGGCFVGQQLNSRLNQRALKQAFAIFLVFMGCFVMIREGSALLSPKEIQSSSKASALNMPEQINPIEEQNECAETTDDRKMSSLNAWAFLLKTLLPPGPTSLTNRFPKPAIRVLKSSLGCRVCWGCWYG